MKYFPLHYRLRAEDRYLIWISNENDSVFVDAAGFVPSFGDFTVLREFAEVNHIYLESDNPIRHDLDWIVKWIAAPATPVNCEKALEAWNLFGDIATSIPSKGLAFKKLDSQLLHIYDKLFWGNNLPAMTPVGERYDPEWSANDVKSLEEILTEGMALFDFCILAWPRKL